MNQILLLPLKVLPTSYLLLPLNAFPISHLLLPLNAFPISHLSLSINALPISQLLLPLNVLPISHLLLLLLDVYRISHPNLLLLLQLLYPKTPRSGNKARWSKTKRKRKRPMLHPTRTTQSRKRALSLPQDEDKTKKKKPIRLRNGNGRIKKSLWRKGTFFRDKVLVDLDHGASHFDIFQTFTGMNELLEIIVTEMLRYTKRSQFWNNGGWNEDIP